VGREGWFGALTAGALVQWVRVDSARKASAGPLVGLLAGRMF
jgi:hypothetical protein